MNHGFRKDLVRIDYTTMTISGNCSGSGAAIAALRWDLPRGDLRTRRTRGRWRPRAPQTLRLSTPQLAAQHQAGVVMRPRCSMVSCVSRSLRFAALTRLVEQSGPTEFGKRPSFYIDRSCARVCAVVATAAAAKVAAAAPPPNYGTTS